jgi:hypothetical protein
MAQIVTTFSISFLYNTVYHTVSNKAWKENFDSLAGHVAELNNKFMRYSRNAVSTEADLVNYLRDKNLIAIFVLSMIGL